MNLDVFGPRLGPLLKSSQQSGVSPFMWGSTSGLDSAAAASAGACDALLPESDGGGVASGDAAVRFPAPACALTGLGLARGWHSRRYDNLLGCPVTA